MKTISVKYKTSQTYKMKYGIDWFVKTDEFKKKSMMTKLIRYGDPNFTNQNKAKKTCIERYGAEYVVSSKYFKKKSKETMIDKYGVTNIMKLDAVARSVADSDIRKQREYETKKKNNTFNSSKEEDKAYEILKQRYPDVQRQFQSGRYPFNCDFYIPSIDLYIECQFGQFHHHRPYTRDETDLKEVEDLRRRSDYIKEKTGRRRTRYDAEIETWTVRDVKKRQVARKNGLNYVEFWNLAEIEKWIK